MRSASGGGASSGGDSKDVDPNGATSSRVTEIVDPAGATFRDAQGTVWQRLPSQKAAVREELPVDSSILDRRKNFFAASKLKEVGCKIIEVNPDTIDQDSWDLLRVNMIREFRDSPGLTTGSHSTGRR